MIGLSGSTGFIGRNLINRFQKENVEYSIFNKERNNLLDIASLKSFVENKEIIFHLAGSSKKSSNQEFLSINTLGVFNLFEANRKYGNARIIFPSSVHVYNITKNLKKFKENDETICTGIGGLSKKFCEDIILHYQKNYGMKINILRLSNVYGPYCEPFKNSVIATFIHSAINNLKLPLEGGEQSRDYVYIDDVIDAFMKVLKLNTNNEILNICTGIPSSLKDVINILEKILNKKLGVDYKSPGERNFLIGDPKKSESILKWKPKIGLEEGLKNTINWEIKNNHKNFL